MKNSILSHDIKLDAAEIAVYGLFLYKDYPEGDASIRAFWHDFLAHKDSVFCDCTGAYRVEIVCADGKQICFADNSGMMTFYVNKKAGKLFGSLSEAEPNRESRRPNFSAIAQFLYYGCIYGNETILESVQRSDPECYYTIHHGVIQECSKQLPSLDAVKTSSDALELQIHRMAVGTDPKRKIGCVITGGTDSRTILSHLLHQQINPLLSITGSSESTDVQIAKEIANTVNEKLYVISDDAAESDDWINKAITAADGMTEICGSYRLYKKARHVAEQRISVEYGGLAGELYKNSFINQDFPFYHGRPRWERFLRYKVATYDFPLTLCGNSLLEEMSHLPQNTIKWLSQFDKKDKVSAYLNAGYRIMQCRGSGLNAMNSQWYIPYNPLLERHVAALALRKAPYSLEGQAYQREQVSRFCPQIKKIRTDRGLTCNSNTIALEYCKSLLFLLSIAANRILKRKNISARTDKCFSDVLSSPQFFNALQRCRELKILAPEITVDQIPQKIADRLFTVGSMF